MVFVGGASHKSSSLKAQKGAALKDDANNLGHRTRMGHGMAADATQASRRARLSASASSTWRKPRSMRLSDPPACGHGCKPNAFC
mmetsp:Transcript_126464/g.188712  ORF Transcript_126464/g.188712 Transcript_126464/m.188712 type:complete len:85 (-) Transcript_126464:21-275(-)